MAASNRRTFVVLYRPVRPGFGPQTARPHEQAAMGDHFEFLKGLLERGDLILAGPRLDAAFGLGVFYADSLEAAQQLIAGDPVVMKGVFGAEVAEMRLSLLAQDGKQGV
jgi:uncharacterized protein YciI